MRNRWDIFCRVIDNYGDIGVCWRLARQLAAEHRLAVRLWVDKLDTLALLCPEVRIDRPRQDISGVEICQWLEHFPETELADVVIEAFACELPANYLAAMARRPAPPVWINLEYLSAEAWVDDCHLRSSPHPTLPLTKYFFFPGFTATTGGLLCEPKLFTERDVARASRQAAYCLELSLFCYEHAPVGALLDAWSAGEQPVRCWVPPGQALHAVARHLGGHPPWQRGNLQITPLPFVTQPEYDHLLWRCDVNFVRGEDSFVRAQWAGAPFVWHIYPQDDAAHLKKLEAFLQRFGDGLPTPAAQAVRAMFLAWNTDGDVATAWSAYLAERSTLAAHGRRWATTLARHGDLCQQLVSFCTGKL